MLKLPSYMEIWMRKFTWNNLKVCSESQQEICLQAQEIIVWSEVVARTMVQEI
jgi:hypothetical protein